MMKKDIPILLVEDDDVDAETVDRAFRKNRIANPLYLAVNGQEAIDFLYHRGKFAEPASSPRPGLILLDLQMPMMNGIEFLKIVKADADLRRIPVVVLTTSREENDRIESFDLSVAGYIVKPVEFEKFVEAIQAINVYWTLCEVCSA